MLQSLLALWPIAWHFAGASGIIVALLLLAWYFPGIRSICLALAIAFGAWLAGYTVGVKNEHAYTVSALDAQRRAFDAATAKLVAAHEAAGVAARAAAEREVPPVDDPPASSGVRNDKPKRSPKSH